MEKLKQQFRKLFKSLSEIPPGAMLFIFAMFIMVPALLINDYYSPEGKLLRELRGMEVVAYNEQSVHTLGSNNYENKTFANWKSILPLEYPYNGYWLKNSFRQGAKAVSISYQSLSDRTEKKIAKVYYQPFDFDESATNSIIKEENGWTTERYNLALIK